MQTDERSGRLVEGGPSSKHIPSLDGVRGLAVAGVLLTHLFAGNATSTVSRYMQSLVAFGANGVDLFFVLSGFLITGILYDSLGERSYLRSFYARRVLRIFPLYYGVLAAFALCTLCFGLHYHRELLSFALYLQNSWLIAEPIYVYAYNSNPILPLSHFWSLAVEEQFYLVWPLLILVLRRRATLLWVCLSSFGLCVVLRFVLALAGANHALINTNTLCRADSLLAGGALSLLLRSRLQQHALRSAWAVLVLSLLAEVLLQTWAPAIDPGSATRDVPTAVHLALRYSFLAAAGAGLIATSLSPGVTQTIFTVKPLRWLGKYSYGIYVYHLIIAGFLQGPLRVFIGHHGVTGKGERVVVSGITIGLLSILLAYLSFHFYERPFLRMKRFFEDSSHRRGPSQYDDGAAVNGSPDPV